MKNLIIFTQKKNLYNEILEINVQKQSSKGVIAVFLYLYKIYNTYTPVTKICVP